MATRRIIVESPPPATEEVVVRRYVDEPRVERRVIEEPVVERRVIDESPVERVERSDALVLAPRQAIETRAPQALEMWADHFAPAIERALPSRDHFFKPVSVSVEREQFFRDQQVVGEALPRRVRVTRRRVTLYGTVGVAR